MITVPSSPSSPTDLPLIVGNWKMNTNINEARAFAESLVSKMDDYEFYFPLEVVLCPPSISLSAVHSVTWNTSIRLGAQNMYHRHSGAFTGEISPTMLSSLCDYVIIGHSERRTLFAENDSAINLKVHAARAQGMTPILCVGETLQEREANETEAVLFRQLSHGLLGVPPFDFHYQPFAIAYEPVWAIGTGKAASITDAERAIQFIRNTIIDLFDDHRVTDITRILYGGSVKSSNILDFMTSSDINGALIGSASINPEEFFAIIHKVASAISWSPTSR